MLLAFAREILVPSGQPRRRRPTAASLVQLPLSMRLAVVAGPAAALWLAVLWALR
jgi:hypothetical protein